MTDRTVIATLLQCDNASLISSRFVISSLPAIEPGRVFVHFGSYGTACLDTATGQALWSHGDLALSPLARAIVLRRARTRRHVYRRGNRRELWSHRISGKFAASPIDADGHLYFCDQDGTTTVLKPGRTYEVLATNILDDGLMASPAADDSALYLRTRTHLYRMEEP